MATEPVILLTREIIPFAGKFLIIKIYCVGRALKKNRGAAENDEWGSGSGGAYGEPSPM